MVFQPITRKKIYTEVFVQLQELFEKGVLKPGEKLPSERELSTMLNVSRNSLREAFRVLEILGLLEIIPGSGTYVRESRDDVILPLAISLSVEQTSMMELMEVRHIIETECASLAATRASEEDLKKLSNTLVEMEKSINNPKSYVQQEILFHYTIARASNNNLLLRLLSTFTDHLHKTLSVLTAKRFTNTEKALSTVKEHEEIFHAIQNRDSALAGKLMQQHLANSSRYLIETTNESD